MKTCLPRHCYHCLFLLLFTSFSASFSYAANYQLQANAQASDLAKATTIKLAPGQNLGKLALNLRDDQIIETANGRQYSVAKIRALQTAFAKARQHSLSRQAAGMPVLATPKIAGTPLKPGETSAQILARPNTDVVRFASGRSASVAQLRAMAPYIKQRYGVDLSNPSNSRPNLNGNTIKISSVNDLKKLPRNTPANTVLESPSGTKVTLGEVRSTIATNRASFSNNPFKAQGVQQ